MAERLSASESTDSFEYMLLEKDPDHFKTVFSGPSEISPWIDPKVLNLNHRIGRGPFGDTWIATHRNCTNEYDNYHEVAVKMLYPIKEDQLQIFSARFDEVFRKCQGIERVCFLHGISIQKGRVCIAMKFYEGSIGDKMVRLKGGKLSLTDAVRYASDLARGVLELHSRGILALNLKPCNFLLDENDHAVVGDVGIPSLLLGLSLPSSELIQRLGTPSYMAPEQWEPKVRGPISYETDSWGFACSIIEMLSGMQPWRGKSPDEIYQLVVLKKEKPVIPDGLPPEIKNVLLGCFNYDLRDRPLMGDILNAFGRCSPELSGSSWSNANDWRSGEGTNLGTADWSASKDKLQIGDLVRSRRPRHTRSPESMTIPEGTVAGVEDEDDREGFLLVRVPGIHTPLKVRPSTVQRVSFGFSACDWVRVMDEKRPQAGILHSIERDGTAAVGLIGMEKLWSGSYTELQMSESYFIGQFVRPKTSIANPRFEWPRKKAGVWATGRISQVLPNGCLILKFPGLLSFGEPVTALADPSEVAAVGFSNFKGLAGKYQHLEDYHWAVRPLFIAFGLFAARALGVLMGGSGKSSKKVVSVPEQLSDEEGQSPPQPPPSAQEGDQSSGGSARLRWAQAGGSKRW